jgi:hypothetical protein
MKTLITKKIDGYEIIIGFSNAVIDPMTSKPIVDELMQKTEEFKILKALIDKADRFAACGFKKQELALNELNDFESLKQDINIAEEAYNEKFQQLYKENANYFEPKIGEEIIDDTEYKHLLGLFENLPMVKKLTRDGQIINDYKGISFFIKIDSRWEYETINLLGEPLPEGAKPMNELTDDDKREITEQRNKEHFNSLSSEEKEAIRTQALESAMERAAIIKARYELEDDPDPLSKAKSWLESERQKIKEQYA